MDKQQIQKWMLDHLNGKKYSLKPKQSTDIMAISKKHKANDGKYYDAYITYLINNNDHAKFSTTYECLEDSINFSKDQKGGNWDSNKLDRLINEIERNLKNGGHYKLELAGNVDFKVSSI